MNIYAKKIIVTAMALALILPCLSRSQAKQLIWGENVGPVSAVVIARDSEKGLGVYEDPYGESKLLDYISKNSNLLGKNIFEKGWMKLDGKPGWVRMDYLKNLPFQSRVIRITAEDNCVPVKKGPDQEARRLGCLRIGQIVEFSGLMTEDHWLELGDHSGWVSKTIFSAHRLPVNRVGDYGKEMDNGASVEDKDTGFFEAGAENEDIITPVRDIPSRGVVIGPGRDRDQDTQPIDNGIAPPNPPEQPGDPYCRGGSCVEDDSFLTEEGFVIDGEPSGPLECLAHINCSLALADAIAGYLDGRIMVTIGVDPALTVLGIGLVRVTRGGEVVREVDCSDGQGGVDSECVAEVMRDIAEPPPAQAQTASTPPTDQTIEGDPEGSGIGELAPPEDKPGGDPPIVSFPRPGSGDNRNGDQETSDEDSGGWMDIEPVRPEGPTFTSDRDRDDTGGKDGSTGSKDPGKSPPVIGIQPDKGQSGGEPPMYTVGEPVGGSGGDSGSAGGSNVSSGGKDLGFTTPGVGFKDSESSGLKGRIGPGKSTGMESPQFDSLDDAFGPIKSGVSIRDASKVKEKTRGSGGSPFTGPDLSSGGSSFTKPGAADSGSSFTKPGVNKNPPAAGKSRSPSAAPSLGSNPSVKGNFEGKRLRKFK